MKLTSILGESEDFEPINKRETEERLKASKRQESALWHLRRQLVRPLDQYMEFNVPGGSANQAPNALYTSLNRAAKAARFGGINNYTGASTDITRRYPNVRVERKIREQKAASWARKSISARAGKSVPVTYFYVPLIDTPENEKLHKLMAKLCKRVDEIDDVLADVIARIKRLENRIEAAKQKATRKYF